MQIPHFISNNRWHKQKVFDMFRPNNRVQYQINEEQFNSYY